MTHAEFAAALEADCSDEHLWLYADWLEDAGDERAAGVRVMAGDKYSRPRPYRTSDLPWTIFPSGAARDIFDAIDGRLDHGGKDFATAIAAIDAAARAYATPAHKGKVT